ncbi:cytochrome C oxidase subunit I [Massilia sp. Dwa41.01b]|uniref:SCO family protein n=1 Tax=unclassified Massilia TaxID=2609279 RepID=UPI00185FF369|nr:MULTISPECIES: cytochrome C oxidase subunit I [unclassified Massilia]QNA87984.1 cytochrome C oxidase subunit I [Massilia sp. Dwa41.01b]QNA98888.1 cytochrome C oxidase subunit I [Massilia sp. Se16.2.3]
MSLEKQSGAGQMGAQAKRTGRWKLFAVLLVCASPIIASYFAYYVIKPSGRTNYGTLIDQRSHPMPKLPSTTLDGRPKTLEHYAGKWLMVKVGGAACDQECEAQLFAMRQLRTMQGKNMERVERVWLITDDAQLDNTLIRKYDGMHLLRVPRAALGNWLPVEAGGKLEDHIFLVDPRSNLMMRFPKHPEPRRVHKDLAKLLRASAIG